MAAKQYRVEIDTPERYDVLEPTSLIGANIAAIGYLRGWVRLGCNVRKGDVPGEWLIHNPRTHVVIAMYVKEVD